MKQVANTDLRLQRHKRHAARKQAALEARCAELTQLLQVREDELALTRSSRSWRITQPLRVLGRALIPIRNKLRIRQRIRNFSFRSAGARYNLYTRAHAKRIDAQSNDFLLRIREMNYRPRFSIVIDGRSGMTGLEKTVHSLKSQIYSYWSATMLRGNTEESCDTSNELPVLIGELRPSTLGGDFLIFLKCGQQLAPNALYEFAARLCQADHVDMVYADEDQVDAKGKRYRPFHKPDWSPDYLETFNYIGFTACFRRSQILPTMQYNCLYDFVLQFTEGSNKIAHIPEVLGHKPRAEEQGIDTASEIAALEGRLNRTKRKGIVTVHPEHPGCYNIKIEMARKPLVSIVIPTAGKIATIDGRKIDFITNLLHQLRIKSTYDHIEIIVVENGDLSADQIAVISQLGGKRITYRGEEFNIAKKLNLGASLVAGELLLLLNDDIEVLTPSWIERMAEHFEKPTVGVVGAKLLYTNETLQHVGVIIDNANPDHVRRHFPRHDAGYFFSTCGTRNYTAVTGACMMVRTQIYRSVGGYSEDFAVSYNDVDFCLKVMRKGLSIVYAPAAELIHMESQSRVPYLDLRESNQLKAKWGKSLCSDRFYNERFLTIAPPTFESAINF
jgi:cellulose synthase/poly-beta-1,6-N-acetylglucosamine synthase-like glycosyltransferase